MNSCKKCSAQWTENLKSCPECGAKYMGPSFKESVERFRETARSHPQAKLIAGLSAAVVLCVAGLGVAISSMKDPLAPASAVDKLAMSEVSWSADGRLASFSVKNENKFALHDLTLYCERLGPGGKTVATAEAALPEEIKGGASKSYKAVDMGKAPKNQERAHCGVIQARRAAP